MANHSISKIAFLLLFITAVCVAQQNQTDSLKQVLIDSGEDSSKVNTLLALSKNYFGSSPDESIRYATQAKDLSVKINFDKGTATAYKNIGIAHYMQGKYLETLEYWDQSLEVFEKIGDDAGVANILNNIGSIYYNQRSDEKALEYYLKSLKISEKINDKLRIATALGNIGNVYGKKKTTYDKALEYYLRGLPISEELKDQQVLGSTTLGIGEIYFLKENYDSALFYYNRALAAYEGNEQVPYALNYIGMVYNRKKEYDVAISYHSKALEISERLGIKLNITQSLLGIADGHLVSGDPKQALNFYKQAESVGKEIGANDELKKIYDGFSKAYFSTRDFQNAYKYQSLLTGIKDTLYNIETDRKLGSLQFDFDIQKKQSEINLLTKDQELKEKEISKQKIVRNGFVGGFTIVLLFAGVFFTQRNRISKEKKRSDELLLNILPGETAEELKATGTAKAKSFDLVTVMFTDFKNFTQASEKLTAEELVQEINYCYSEFDKITEKYGLEKIKTIGDSYMCAGGLPSVNTTHAEDIVNAGLEMQQFIMKNKAERMAADKPYFELRCGIHTGPVVAGIVGIKKFAYDIWGDTVNTASRMESSGEVGKVNISGTTYQHIKDKFPCVHRGKIEAKNKGMIDMYFVEQKNQLEGKLKENGIPFSVRNSDATVA